MNSNTALNVFRWTAISEGISYIALLANMLFVKPSDLVLYKSLLYPIGMSHGVLFIGYIILAILLKKSQKWSLINLGIIHTCSWEYTCPVAHLFKWQME